MKQTKTKYSINKEKLNTRNSGKIFSIAILILIISIFTGCNFVTDENLDSSDVFSLDSDISLRNFNSEEELNEFIKKLSSQNYNNFNVARSGLVGAPMVESSFDTAGSIAVSEGAKSSLDFSETNVQVQGIDEADIIKTDGNHIYTISDRVLFIIKAFPGEDAEVISKITLEYYPNALFLKDEKLVVFGSIFDKVLLEKYGFKGYSSKQIVQVYDIESRNDVKLINEVVVDGNYREARMLENYIYFVTNSFSDEFYPYPVIYRDGTIETIPARRIFYYPLPYNSIQYVNIFAFDINDIEEGYTFDIEQKTIVVDNIRNVYMSHENIYITTSEFINQWEISQEKTKLIVYDLLPRESKDLIDRILDVDSDILSDYEKEMKVMEIHERFIRTLKQSEQKELREQIDVLTQRELDKYESNQYTLFYRVNIDGLNLNIEADGKLPGVLVNQFAMDEKNDILRVAVTLPARWNIIKRESSKSENRIYTLDMDLEIIEVKKNIAIDERIYSARFVDDRVYMVTFREVDPFFVFEIDNRGRITQLGELKIPGFSNYLHPYDENTIIGIGKDATDDGRVQGLKISLFDVSDVSNPIEIAKWISDARYSNSNALYEHKAFLFSKERNLLVIPAFSYEWVYEVKGDYRTGRNVGYNGALVFNVYSDEISLKGLIEHESSFSWAPAVERSLYIEDLLYTKSLGMLKINEIDTLKEIKSIKLDYQRDNFDKEIEDFFR